jgi:hypothetical protein
MAGDGRTPNARGEQPTPGWYRRLPPALQRVAAESDQVSAIRLDADLSLRGAVEALAGVLKTERPADVEALSQRISDGICRRLGVPVVVVRVRERRPELRHGELHGLYTPGNGRCRDQIEVWMRTLKRDQVVAYRTFLRTLIHELCHHLDYHLLHLHDSLHTQGFYQRESSLFAALGAFEVPHR